MICPNCKSNISDESKFCTKCGHKIEKEDIQTESQQVNTEQNAAPVPQQTNAEQNAAQTPQQPNAEQNAAQTPQQPNTEQNAAPIPQQYAPNQNVAPKKPVNKKVLFSLVGGGAALIVIIAVVLILSATHKSTINLSDYVAVEFSGYDSCGTAEIEFDYTSFYNDIEKKGKNVGDIDTDDISLSTLYSYISDNTWSDLYNMIDSVNYTLDKTDGLSNGDTVIVGFEFDNDAAKKFKLKFVGNDTEFEVSGLEEVTEIDPFDGVFLSFTGTSPNVYASIECDNSDNQFFNNSPYSYELSKSSGISKGDVITVSIDESENEYYIEKYGLKLSSFTKEFTCDKVDSYVDSLDAINDDTLNSMKSQTEDVIEAYFANNKDYISYKDLKYVGCYFLTAKSSDTWSSKNICYVIYSATVSSVKDSDGKTAFDATKVFLPVKFTDIIEYSDGTQYVDLSDGSSISGKTSLELGWSYVNGYTSQDVMYSELVASEKANYTEDISPDLK